MLHVQSHIHYSSLGDGQHFYSPNSSAVPADAAPLCFGGGLFFVGLRTHEGPCIGPDDVRTLSWVYTLSFFSLNGKKNSQIAASTQAMWM